MTFKSFKRFLKNKIPKNIRDFFFSIKKLPKRFQNHNIIEDNLKNTKCIEMGGPTENFFTKLRIYQNIESLEVVNFSRKTVWENNIKEGYNCNYYGNRIAFQHILECSNLSRIKSKKYDAVLSSHNLEHVANPIKALNEWNRITKSKGFLLLILPNKLNTFDIYRPYTTFEHIKKDFENNVGEDDMTHYNEIIEFTDISRDPGVKNKEEHIFYSKRNFENRRFHHHVFDRSLINKMIEFSNYEIINYLNLDYDLITFCKKNN
jgi:SAM-dependent methyltransferase